MIITVKAKETLRWLVPRVAIILLVACLTACKRGSNEVVLRLHGSNTIGRELAPALVEGYLKQAGAKDIRRIEGDVPDEVKIQAVLPGEDTVKIVEIKAHGSDTAVQALEEGKCDIAMMSRRLKGDEAERLARLGGMNEHVIAMDGIAIIVNTDNAVRELNLGQVAQIFTGDIRDWSQVKGRSGGINVYARDDKSGTFDTFKNLVLGKDKKLYTTRERFEDSKLLSEAVAADPNGIGFVALPFIGSTKAVALYEEGGQAYLPSPMTINQRKYLLHRELYFYLPKKNQVRLAEDFIKFAESKEGQDIVGKVGFVSQNISPVVPAATPEPAAEDIPAELARIRKAYKGTSNLPPLVFSTGVSDLDSKSLVDFGRIVGLLETDGAKEITVVGFADNTGTPAKNLALSEERAKHVKEEFVRIGYDPASITVKQFGQEAPVRLNDTDEGRRLNRRVEVYYK